MYTETVFLLGVEVCSTAMVSSKQVSYMQKTRDRPAHHRSEMQDLAFPWWWCFSCTDVAANTVAAIQANHDPLVLRAFREGRLHAWFYFLILVPQFSSTVSIKKPENMHANDCCGKPSFQNFFFFSLVLPCGDLCEVRSTPAIIGRNHT